MVRKSDKGEAIERVSMDMWPAFINATLKSLPSINPMPPSTSVRRWTRYAAKSTKRWWLKAMRALKAASYDRLYNPENMTRRPKLRFKVLRDSTLETARACGVKEFAMSLSRHRQGKAVSGGCHGQCAVAGNNQGSSVGNIERCCFGSK